MTDHAEQRERFHAALAALEEDFPGLAMEVVVVSPAALCGVEYTVCPDGVAADDVRFMCARIRMLASGVDQ